MDFLYKLFDSQGFMPHGYCFLWFPDILYLHVVSDLCIALAYFAIPTLLFILVKRNRGYIPFPWVFRLFALFILLCGLTHVVQVITLWYPIYYFQGVLKVLTAAVSLGTAFLMMPLVPRLITAMPYATDGEQQTVTKDKPERPTS